MGRSLKVTLQLRRRGMGFLLNGFALFVLLSMLSCCLLLTPSGGTHSLASNPPFSIFFASPSLLSPFDVLSLKIRRYLRSYFSPFLSFWHVQGKTRLEQLLAFSNSTFSLMCSSTGLRKRAGQSQTTLTRKGLKVKWSRFCNNPVSVMLYYITVGQLPIT